MVESRQDHTVDRNHIDKPGRQSGVSLMEVLIALAVLSIGLAGIAAMQITTLQFVHSAHYRSMASAIALDLEERLWLALADDELAGCPSTGNEEGTPIAEMLAHWSREYVGGEEEGDWNWSDSAMLKVPNLQIGVGEPEGTAPDGVIQVPVTLSWDENRFADLEGGDPAESFTYNVRILCRSSGEEEEEEA